MPGNWSITGPAADIAKTMGVQKRSEDFMVFKGDVYSEGARRAALLRGSGGGAGAADDPRRPGRRVRRPACRGRRKAALGAPRRITRPPASNRAQPLRDGLGRLLSHADAI